MEEHKLVGTVIRVGRESCFQYKRVCESVVVECCRLSNRTPFLSRCLVHMESPLSKGTTSSDGL